MSFQALLSAAMNQNKTELARALDSFSINEIGPEGFSAITHLASKNNMPAVEFLLSNGAEINDAAFGAAKAGHLQYSEALRVRKASINAIAGGLAFNGQKEEVDKLLSEGANIHHVVYWSAIGRHKKQVKAFLGNGASIHVAGWGAAVANQQELLQFLMAQGANTHLIAQGLAQGGHVELANEFIQSKKASIHSVAQGAAQKGNMAHVRHLLAQGANLHVIARGSALGGHLQQVKEWIASDANLNEIAYGAAQGTHMLYVEELLKLGANINSAAEGAARGGNIEYAETLMQRGASVSSVAQGFAAGGFHNEANALIMSNDEIISNVAKAAASAGFKEYAENLLLRGADINAVAEGAAYGGYKEYANELLHRGALIENIACGAAHGGHLDHAKEILALHPEHISHVAKGAAQGGYHSYLDSLLKLGANLDLVAGMSAFHNYKAYTEKLLLNGANLDKVAHHAAWGGYQDYTKALVCRKADINEAALGALRGPHHLLAQYLFNREAYAELGISANIQWVARTAAYNNYKDSSKFLLSCGTSVNDLIEGTARSARHDDVEALLAKDALIHYAIRGAAYGGHQAYTHSLLQRDNNLYINYAAEGAACGKHCLFVEELLSLGANINHAALGAAQGNHRSYAQELHRRGANINYLARGAARNGDKDYLLELKGNHGVEQDWIVQGAAEAGYLDLAEANVCEGGSAKWLAYGAGSIGNKKYVDKLCIKDKSLASYAIQGAAFSGNFSLAEKWAAHYKCSTAFLSMAEGAAEGAHKAIVAKLITTHGDVLYANAVKGAAKGGHKHYTKELMARDEPNLIEAAIKGAAQGGHESYAEEWMAQCGLSLINQVLLASSQAGHKPYMEKLIQRGGDIEIVAREIFKPEYLKDSNEMMLLKKLSHYSSKTISSLIQSLENAGPIHWTKQVLLKRAEAIADYMVELQISYSEAYTKTNWIEKAYLSKLAPEQLNAAQEIFNHFWTRMNESADKKNCLDKFESSLSTVVEIKTLLIHHIKALPPEIRKMVLEFCLAPKVNKNIFSEFFKEEGIYSFSFFGLLPKFQSTLKHLLEEVRTEIGTPKALLSTATERSSASLSPPTLQRMTEFCSKSASATPRGSLAEFLLDPPPLPALPSSVFDKEADFLEENSVIINKIDIDHEEQQEDEASFVFIDDLPDAALNSDDDVSTRSLSTQRS